MLDHELETLISQQLIGRGVSDEYVVSAFRTVPRAAFVPEYLMHKRYADDRLPIGLGQTLSPPYVVARMLQELGLDPKRDKKRKHKRPLRVLEIGTGAGYQTALLSRIATDVYTVEISPELSARARKLLVDDMGLTNVHFLTADGYQGWSDSAPFDGIIVSVASVELPWPLVGQVRDGGRLVMPIGTGKQQLHVMTKDNKGVESTRILPPEEFTSDFKQMQGEALEDL